MEYYCGTVGGHKVGAGVASGADGTGEARGMQGGRGQRHLRGLQDTKTRRDRRSADDVWFGGVHRILAFD
jgi:hypothetical protein